MTHEERVAEVRELVAGEDARRRARRAASLLREDPHGYFRLAHWVALSGVAALSLVAGLLVGLIIGAQP